MSNYYLLNIPGWKGHISESRVESEYGPATSGLWSNDGLRSQESITAGGLIKRKNLILDYALQKKQIN